MLLPSTLRRLTGKNPNEPPRRLRAGVGASGEGGARARARPEGRADQTGEAGADGEKIRQEGGHEGDVAPGEPETSGPGKPSTTKPWTVNDVIIRIFLPRYL